MDYEELLEEAREDGITVYENYKFNSSNIKGLYCDNNIALNHDIETNTEKSCVLAEEIGHHCTTSGNIIEIQKVDNRKQEYRARLYGYNLKIGLLGFVRAYEAGCHSLYDIAEYLDVTEEYLKEAIKCYTAKYGKCVAVDNYAVCFVPYLAVAKITRQVSN